MTKTRADEDQRDEVSKSANAAFDEIRKSVTGGRRWKSPEDIRCVHLSVYLTREEDRRLKILARGQRRTVGDYVRWKALNGRTKPEHAKLKEVPIETEGDQETLAPPIGSPDGIAKQ